MGLVAVQAQSFSQSLRHRTVTRSGWTENHVADTENRVAVLKVATLSQVPLSAHSGPDSEFGSFWYVLEM